MLSVLNLCGSNIYLLQSLQALLSICGTLDVKSSTNCYSNFTREQLWDQIAVPRRQHPQTHGPSGVTSILIS